MNMPSLPAINTESRYLLAKLAFGEHVREKSFYLYIPLIAESNIKNNNTALKKGAVLNDQNNYDPHCSSSISQTVTLIMKITLIMIMLNKFKMYSQKI